MEKQTDLNATTSGPEKIGRLRTLIKNIPATGSELTEAQLRLVAGGKPKKTYRGMTGCIPRGNRPDYVVDA